MVPRTEWDDEEWHQAQDAEDTASSIDLNLNFEEDDSDGIQDSPDVSFTKTPPRLVQREHENGEDPFQFLLSQSTSNNFASPCFSSQQNTPQQSFNKSVKLESTEDSPQQDSPLIISPTSQLRQDDLHEIVQDPLFHFHSLPTPIRSRLEELSQKLGSKHCPPELLNQMSQTLQSHSYSQMVSVLDSLCSTDDQELQNQIPSPKMASKWFQHLFEQEISSSQAISSQQILPPPKRVKRETKEKPYSPKITPSILFFEMNEEKLQTMEQEYIFMLDYAENTLQLRTQELPLCSKVIKLVNRILGRHLYSNFLQVQFNKCSFNTMQKVLHSIIRIGNVEYRYFIFSASMLREARVYFVRCNSLEQVFNLLSSIGRIPKSVNPNKAATKFSLFCSKVEETNICIPLSAIKVKPDLLNKNRMIMTEGCGEAGEAIFKQVSNTLSLQHVPTVLQIRLYSFKGCLVYNPTLDPHEIIIRESMQKFSLPCTEQNNLSIHASLDLIGYNKSKSICSRLNIMLLLLFHSLKIPTSYFMKLLEDYLAELDFSTNVDKLLAFLKRNKFESSNSEVANNNNAQLLLEYALAGHELQLPFMQVLMKVVKRTALLSLRQKLNIPLPNSCYLYGVYDPTHQLPANSLFVKVNGQAIIGQVLINKSPCLFSSDVQVMSAVACEELHYLDNVVVFSVQSEKPDYALISGGDLDGDQYLVMWDAALVEHVKQSRQGQPKLWNTIFEPQQQPLIAVPPPSQVEYYSSEDLYQCSKTMFLDHISTSQHYLLGMITNYWYCWTDKNNCFFNKSTQLACLAAKSVDSAKTGEQVQLPSDLISKEYPHWMKTEDESSTTTTTTTTPIVADKKKYYHSTSLLGVLFDKIKDLDIHLETEFPSTSTFVDEDLLLIGYQQYVSIVRNEYAAYSEDIKKELSKVPVSHPQYERAKWKALQQLNPKYFQRFLQLCKGKSMEQVLQLVSGYYFVTNESSIMSGKNKMFCYSIGLHKWLHRIKSDALARKRTHSSAISLSIDVERFSKYWN